MADLNESHFLIRVMLKKLVPGFGMAEAAQDTKSRKVKIGDGLAVIAVFGPGINIIKGLEKESGNVSFELWISGYENFLAGVSGIKHYLREKWDWAAFGRIFELSHPLTNELSPGRRMKAWLQLGGFSLVSFPHRSLRVKTSTLQLNNLAWGFEFGQDSRRFHRVEDDDDDELVLKGQVVAPACRRAGDGEIRGGILLGRDGSSGVADGGGEAVFPDTQHEAAGSYRCFSPSLMGN